MPFRNSTLSISILLVTLTLHLLGCEKREEPVSTSSSSLPDQPRERAITGYSAKSSDDDRAAPLTPLAPQLPENNQTSPEVTTEIRKLDKTGNNRVEANRAQARAADARSRSARLESEAPSVGAVREREASTPEAARAQEAVAQARQSAARVEAARQEAARIERSQGTARMEAANTESVEKAARLSREPASSQSASGRDAFAAIDEAIQQMEKAYIAFNAPKTMNRADTVMIQLLLSMNQATDDLTKLLKGKGEKESAVVSVAGIMEARLSGPNFEITATTPEEQPISRLEKTEWRWDVKSKSIGEHDLHLTLTAIFDVEGTQRKRAIRTFDQIITVNVTTGQQLADFLNGNWQWLWAAIAVPLAGAIWRGKRTPRRTKR